MIYVVSFIMFVLSIFITPSTYARSTPLLFFFDRNENFDQQFQRALTDLLYKESKGFKLTLLAKGEKKTKQTMERHKVSEEDFPIVLVLAKDSSRVEKRLPQKRSRDSDKAALEAFRQITGKVIEQINPQDGAEMVYIPEGEFIMGTDQAEIDRIWQRFGWEKEWKQYFKNESPKHQVYVDGFWMYRYEVTVAQYRKFCQETGRQMPPEPKWGWQDNYPIVNVSYDDAVNYCKWAGVRLPTEAEWEYAARGGNTGPALERSEGLNEKPRYIFVWGDELPKGLPALPASRKSSRQAGAAAAQAGKGGYGNFADESIKKKFLPSSSGQVGWIIFEGYDDGYVYTAPVGSFNHNGFGLYDMAGNVWEWCTDWYDENYYQNSPSQNPQGHPSSLWRVLRGGSWYDDPYFVRAANRDGVRPHLMDLFWGFRCSSPRFPR